MIGIGNLKDDRARPAKWGLAIPKYFEDREVKRKGTHERGWIKKKNRRGRTKENETWRREKKERS